MTEQQQLNLPGPEPAPTYKPQPAQLANSSGKTRRRIFSADECLDLLGRLAGLVALGIIRPNQASVMRGALRDILSFHQRSTGSQAGPAVDGRLLDLLPENPELMNLLTPFLSDEQIALLMKGATDGDQSQT